MGTISEHSGMQAATWQWNPPGTKEEAPHHVKSFALVTYWLYLITI
jgi:hypothetical protein